MDYGTKQEVSVKIYWGIKMTRCAEYGEKKKMKEFENCTITLKDYHTHYHIIDI